MDLVTGATGHIGNVLVRSLLERGRKVRALVRPGKNPLALQDLNIELAAGDVLDPDSLARVMQGVDVVYHLAARISVAAGPAPETERINLEGTRNVLAAARRAGIRRLVYASSIYALRIPAAGLVDESSRSTRSRRAARTTARKPRPVSRYRPPRPPGWTRCSSARPR
jgi:dihydroflavonol-4-reductase